MARFEALRPRIADTAVCKHALQLAHVSRPVILPASASIASSAILRNVVHSATRTAVRKRSASSGRSSIRSRSRRHSDLYRGQPAIEFLSKPSSGNQALKSSVVEAMIRTCISHEALNSPGARPCRIQCPQHPVLYLQTHVAEAIEKQGPSHHSSSGSQVASTGLRQPSQPASDIFKVCDGHDHEGLHTHTRRPSHEALVLPASLPVPASPLTQHRAKVRSNTPHLHSQPLASLDCSPQFRSDPSQHAMEDGAIARHAGRMREIDMAALSIGKTGRWMSP